MYINEGDVENLILQDIDSSFSVWIASIIDMVGAYIDQYCGTSFATEQTATVKYYDSFGTDELFIDPLISISSIVILDIYGNEEITLSTNDYFTYPLNDPTSYSLKLRPGASIGRFPDRVNAIKVTGTFGFTTVPSPVKLAAIKLTAKIINEGLRGGQVGSETLGSYTVSYRELDDSVEALGVKEILNQYRKLELQ
jgi:hypothetical protein